MTTRVDIYSKVHKGLRKALFELSYAAGRTDYRNDEEIISLAKLFNEVVHFLEQHGRNEDLYQLPLLEMKNPGSTKHDDEAHRKIEKQIERLKQNFNNLVSSIPKERSLKGEVFYHLFNEFISTYLIHMQDEELYTAKLFHELCTDEELNSAFEKIVSNTSPQDMMLMLRYMIPAINRMERIELMVGIKKNAPQPAFNAIMILAQSILSIEEWEYLHNFLSSKNEFKERMWEAVA